MPSESDDRQVDEEPMTIAFYGCRNCRTITGGVVPECPGCGEEKPHMKRVVPSERGMKTGVMD